MHKSDVHTTDPMGSYRVYYGTMECIYSMYIEETKVSYPYTMLCYWITVTILDAAD